MAVARNVEASYSNQSMETAGNAGVDSHDTYSSTVAVQAANLPFLKGISLSKADDAVYWAKGTRQRHQGRVLPILRALPLLPRRAGSTREEFEEYDSAKEAELAALGADIDNVDNLDGIKSALGSTLESLDGYFFDKVRKARVKA